MPYYMQVSRCINPHSDATSEFFDPARSDSKYPKFFCCSQCEHDWVANRLKSLTLSDVLDIQARLSAVAMVAFAATVGN
jgi:hypothetical protein